MGETEGGIKLKIRWLGHSCFYITSDNGTRILTDPFAESVGYRLPDVEADIVTVSHNHYDHNNTRIVKGQFKIFNNSGSFEHKGVQIKGISSFHDDVKGSKRGGNIIFVLNVDDVRICHLGDLGHVIDESTASEIGQIDVLLVPVGGTFTVDAQKAREVIELIKPGTIIPMHYKTPDLSFEIAGVGDFTRLFDSARIKKIENLQLDFTNKQDYEGNIILMNYK